MKLGNVSAFKSAYPEAINMVGRYEAMQAGEKADFESSLRANPKLRNFLRQAIDYLRTANEKESDNHDIAHFLMGKISGHQLPEKLARWVRDNDFQPTEDLKKTLNNLLKTFQQGWRREDHSKTKEKLKFLSDQVEKIVDKSFSGSNAGGISKDEVEKHIFGTVSNPFIPESGMNGRNESGVAPKRNIDELKALGDGPFSKNMFIYIGEITDLDARKSASKSTSIILRNDPSLLLFNSSSDTRSVVRAAGAALQTEIFTNQGLPDTNGAAKKLNFENDDQFLISCASADMKTSHGINSILVTNRGSMWGTTNATSAMNDREHCATQIIEKTGEDQLIMSINTYMDDIELAMAILEAEGKKNPNPTKKIILIAGSDDSESEIRRRVEAREKELETQAKQPPKKDSLFITPGERV